MDEGTSSSQCLQGAKELTPLYPAPDHNAFNSSTATAPFTPSTDVPSSFNPPGMPYFVPFPAYPPVNFQYFPSATVPPWRPMDPSLPVSLPAPYPSNTALHFPHNQSPAFPDYSKKRKARKLYTPAQIDILIREFRKHSYVSKEDKRRIGKMTGIPEEKVKIWYQNRRYKEKHAEGESTCSEGRRTRSPREEEKPSSNFCSPTQPSETAWLPDLSAPPIHPPFIPSAYAPQPFSFFPPSAYPQLGRNQHFGYHDNCRTQLTQYHSIAHNQSSKQE